KSRGKNPVTDFEACDIFAGCLNFSSQCHAENRATRFADPPIQPCGYPLRAWNRETAHAHVTFGDGGRMNAKQNLVILRRRFRHVDQPEHFGRAVSVVNNGFHSASPSCATVITTFPFLRPVST